MGVRHHLTRLRVTRDVAPWDIIPSIELIGDLSRAINLYKVKTGEAQIVLWLVCGGQVQKGSRGHGGETNTQALSLLLPPSLSIPFSLLLTRSLSLRLTVCLPSPPSISLTPLRSDLSQTQRGSLVYSHTERGVIISRSEWSCLFAGPFRTVWRSKHKSKKILALAGQ